MDCIKINVSICSYVKLANANCYRQCIKILALFEIHFIARKLQNRIRDLRLARREGKLKFYGI